MSKKKASSSPPNPKFMGMDLTPGVYSVSASDASAVLTVDANASATVKVNASDELRMAHENYLQMMQTLQSYMPEIFLKKKAPTPEDELLKDLPYFVKRGKTPPYPEAKYVLMPGNVYFNRSKFKCYYLSAEQLAALYGVPFDQCLVVDLNVGPANHKDEENHVYLAPRRDANFDLKKVHTFAKVKVPKKVLKKAAK